MLILKLALRNLFGAGMRTWLNVLVTSVSFTIIIFFNAMYDGMREDSRRIMADTEVAGGHFWHPEYDPYDPLTIEDSHGIIPEELIKEVSSGSSGHAEVVEVLFDPTKTQYEKMARLFFEIHDPTQKNRQGPDVGSQYRSAVFYDSREQKATADHLIGLLRKKGFKVATQVVAARRFWPAEDYHQDYYQRTGGEPYCHARVKRF